MKKLCSSFIAFCLMILSYSVPSFGATEGYHTGKIHTLYFWPNNRIPFTKNTSIKLAIKFVNALGTTSACNTTARVSIDSDHPMWETVLSIVMTAKASDKKITVAYLDTCSVWSNSADISQIQVIE